MNIHMPNGGFLGLLLLFSLLLFPASSSDTGEIINSAAEENSWDRGGTDIYWLRWFKGAQERLCLFRANLCEEGSFDYAIHGCRSVFHVATPTDFGSQDPEREVIETAVRGTLNVLKSCLTTKSVRRVVYTSSASAASFPEKPVEIIDESCWSLVDLIRQNKPPGWMYYVSKTLADQVALQFAKENKMEVVSMVPVTVVGPWLTTTIPSSVDVTMSLITDVCRAHLFLMEQPTVGERYICCAHSTTLSGFVDFICKRYPKYKIDFQLDNAESDGGVITMYPWTSSWFNCISCFLNCIYAAVFSLIIIIFHLFLEKKWIKS